MSVAGLTRWVANGGLDYIGSKVIAGERKTYDEEVAREDVIDHLKNGVEEGSYEHASLTEMVEDFMDWHSQYHVVERLIEADGDNYELGGVIGWSPSWNLIAARAACRCLVAHLDQNEALAEVSEQMSQAPAAIPVNGGIDHGTMWEELAMCLQPSTPPSHLVGPLRESYNAAWLGELAALLTQEKT